MSISPVAPVPAPSPLPPPVLLRLSWTHLLELIRLEDPWQRAFYENECLKGGWSKRQLQRQIASGGLDHQLFASRYLVALPKPEQLRQLIETDRAAWQQHHTNPRQP